MMRTRATRYRHCGFTLLELLAAAVITAVLLTAVFGALRGTLQLRNREDEALSLDAARQHCLEVLAADLSAALLPGGRLAGSFLGAHDEENGNARDTLEFATAAGPVRHGESGADALRVGYELVESDNGMTGALVRSVYSNLLAYEEEDPQERVLLANVYALEFTYFHDGEWLDSWDSSTNDNGLPEAVQVRIEPRSADGAVAYAPLQIIVPVLVRPESAATASEAGGSVL